MYGILSLTMSCWCAHIGTCTRICICGYSVVNCSMFCHMAVHAFRGVNVPVSLLPRMWQVALGNLLSWTNLCPRASFAESALLVFVSWGYGFLCGGLLPLSSSPHGVVKWFGSSCLKPYDLVSLLLQPIGLLATVARQCFCIILYNSSGGSR